MKSRFENDIIFHIYINMNDDELYNKTIFVPGFFRDQLKYSHFSNGQRINKFQCFIFPFINKQVSIQAGIDIPSGFKINNIMKKYPFLDLEDLQIRTNLNYQNGFDREEASIQKYNVKDAVLFSITIHDNDDLLKVYHPKEFGFSRREYNRKRWNSIGYGTFITSGEIQRILNKLFKLDLESHEKLKIKSAIIIQKFWRGWYTRFQISWNPNTNLGNYYLLRKIEKDLKTHNK